MSELLQRTRRFHDRWAESINTDRIRISDYFEACTAPENRFCLGHLGAVNGRQERFTKRFAWNITVVATKDAVRPADQVRHN